METIVKSSFREPSPWSRKEVSSASFLSQACCFSCTFFSPVSASLPVKWGSYLIQWLNKVKEITHHIKAPHLEWFSTPLPWEFYISTVFVFVFFFWNTTSLFCSHTVCSYFCTKWQNWELWQRPYGLQTENIYYLVLHRKALLMTKGIEMGEVGDFLNYFFKVIVKVPVI